MWVFRTFSRISTVTLDRMLAIFRLKGMLCKLVTEPRQKFAQGNKGLRRNKWVIYHFSPTPILLATVEDQRLAQHVLYVHTYQ